MQRYFDFFNYFHRDFMEMRAQNVIIAKSVRFLAVAKISEKGKGNDYFDAGEMYKHQVTAVCGGT